MPAKKSVKSLPELERAAKEARSARYVLHLYIAGNTPQSRQALINLRQVCETYLHGRYRLDVIDIRQQPGLAREAQIIAAPTLVKQHPLPIRRIVGSMTQIDRILIGLGLQPA